MKSLQCSIVVCILTLFSCEKEKEKEPVTDINTTPFIEFTIQGNTKRVDCEKIVLDASTQSDVSDGGGTSNSTKFFFNFTFPSKRSKMDSLSPGYYPLRTNNGYGTSYYQPEDIFQFNFQFPLNQALDDYYRSLDAPVPASNPGADEPRNEIVKIIKGVVVNNRQIYVVEGRYVALVKLKNASQNPPEIVKGSYLLRLQTLPE